MTSGVGAVCVFFGVQWHLRDQPQYALMKMFVGSDSDLVSLMEKQVFDQSISAATFAFAIALFFHKPGWRTAGACVILGLALFS